MMWTAAALRDATGGMLRAPFSASGVSIDTRTLRPGDLFVALVGENGDGHAHVAEALARGAAGAMALAGGDIIHQGAAPAAIILSPQAERGLTVT